MSSLINSWINWDFSWSWSSTSWLVTLELECLWSGVWSVFSVCPRQFCDHDLLMWLCDMDQASDADLFFSHTHSFTSLYNREHSPQQSFPLLNFEMMHSSYVHSSKSILQLLHWAENISMRLRKGHDMSLSLKSGSMLIRIERGRNMNKRFSISTDRFKTTNKILSEITK